MTLNINVPGGKSEITIERGALSKAGGLLDLDRKVLIVTDSGVPSEKIIPAETATAFSDPAGLDPFVILGDLSG